MTVRLWFAALALLSIGCSSAGDVVTGTEAPRAQAVADESVRTATDLLLEAIGDHRLTLIGEMHGTKETPALIGDAVEHLVSNHEAVVLALEIADREQPAIDAYLASSGTAADRAALLASPHWAQPPLDGRSSVAMFDLIERMRVLRAGGNDIAVALFDPDGSGDRARGMADRLRALVVERPQARVLVLTGNMHATIAAPEWLADDGARIEPPMTAGRYLHDLDPKSVFVYAAAGEHWVCTDDVCKPQPVGPSAAGVVPRLDKSPPGQPWHAMLILPAVTASVPAHPDAGRH